MIKLSDQIKEAEGKMKDVRFREWLKLDSKISQALLYIINAENILGELDDFSLENDQCYPEFEDFCNEIAAVRAEITRYVDENPEILEISSNNLNM